MAQSHLRITSLLLLIVLLPSLAVAQTRFVIEQLPATTPREAQMFLAGSFNGWTADSPTFAFQAQPDGYYALQVEDLPDSFAYKITRGDWQRVEADAQGRPMPNRIFRNETLPREIRLRIAGWEDFPPTLSQDSVRLHIINIPNSTPRDAALYVTGSFNDWRTDDPAYRLRLQLDSSFAVKVPLRSDTLEYKFTRGNWSSVEGRASGRARFNRKLVAAQWDGQPVRIQIASWEDISGTPINVYTIFWLMAAIQGLLIIVAINTLDRNNLPANRLLTAMLLLISLALLSRVAIYDRDIFNWAPKLLLLPDLIYFLYAPVFVLYIQRLLRPHPRAIDLQTLLHFVPFVMHLLAYLPLFLMAHQVFINQAVGLELRPYFIWAAGVALPYNAGYWLYARRKIRDYQHASDHQYSAGSNLDFLRNVMTIKGICLALWVLTFAVGVYGHATDTDVTLITDRSTDVIWIGFSLTVFLLGYYAMKEPEIFRIPDGNDSPEPVLTLLRRDEPARFLGDKANVEHETEPEAPAEDEPLLDEALKTRLETLMKEEQPFYNPKLTLSELAELAGTNPHELSRAINQGFGMNFNDFVNSYRVEAFKQHVVEPQYQNHTFLAVAMMVGFNSKTAFNRSFKKLTGETPREYFKAVVEE
jgi:AraC-like DNA-binding protein